MKKGMFSRVIVSPPFLSLVFSSYLFILFYFTAATYQTACCAHERANMLHVAMVLLVQVMFYCIFYEHSHYFDRPK